MQDIANFERKTNIHGYVSNSHSVGLVFVRRVGHAVICQKHKADYDWLTHYIYTHACVQNCEVLNHKTANY